MQNAAVDYSFAGCHSFLVNKERETIQQGQKGELLLENNTTIPVSRRKKAGSAGWLK